MTNYNYGKLKVKIIQEFNADSVETVANAYLTNIQEDGGIIQKIETHIPSESCSYYTVIIMYVEVEKNE